MMLTIEADPEPRNTEYHRAIVRITPIEGTKTGNNVELDCGHRCQTFGSLAHAQGRIYCSRCRDEGVRGKYAPEADTP